LLFSCLLERAHAHLQVSFDHFGYLGMGVCLDR